MGQSVGFVHIWLQNRVPLEKDAYSVCAFCITLGCALSVVHLKQDFIFLAAMAY